MMGKGSISSSKTITGTIFSRLLFVVASAWCALFLLGTGASAKTAVLDARLGEHDNMTRFVMELDSTIKFRTFSLKDPDRVVLEIPLVDWNASVKKGLGHVKAVRYAPYQKGLGRIVLDLGKPAVVQKSFLIPPRDGKKWRLVVDLSDSATPPKAVASAPSTPAKPGKDAAKTPKVVAAAPQPAAPAPARKLVVMIDPGHGGADPGAIGVSGTYEKNITLAFAREAQAAFNKQGRYKAVLTRSRDIFIPLRERIAIARANGADLFLSIHADSTQNSSTRGLSVYTLSKNASDAEAAALAEKENKADLIAGMDLSHESPEVANILIDLAQRETMNLSAIYATTLIDEIGRETSLLNNTHRFAGFAVLKAPDVPSVLVELGYLSNSQDERLLRQTAYRAKLVTALVRSVDRFFAQAQKARKP